MPTQYNIAEMNLPAKLKLVGTLYGRGYSTSRIARELNCDLRTAQKYVATIVERYREFDDVDKHLRDVNARMGEQLAKLAEQEGVLWKQLDWACEWVIQKDGMGKPIYEHQEDAEAEGGASLRATPLYGPRKAGMVPQLVGQLQSINKQQAEMLGLLSKNVDISVTLQKTELFQIRIMEVIQDTDPGTYKKLLRALQAAESTFAPQALPAGASGRDPAAALTGEYQARGR